MLRRIQLLAEFVREHHEEEFEAYWAAYYSGSAQAKETLEFWCSREFIATLLLSRKVYLLS